MKAQRIPAARAEWALNAHRPLSADSSLKTRGEPIDTFENRAGRKSPQLFTSGPEDPEPVITLRNPVPFQNLFWWDV